MFRASSCPSSGATTTTVAASGLPSELGDSSAVGRVAANSTLCTAVGYSACGSVAANSTRCTAVSHSACGSVAANSALCTAVDQSACCSVQGCVHSTRLLHGHFWARKISFVYSKTSRPALGPTMLSLQWAAASFAGVKAVRTWGCLLNPCGPARRAHSDSIQRVTWHKHKHLCVCNEHWACHRCVSAANGYTNPMTFIAGVRSNRCDANCYCPRQLAAFHKHHNGGWLASPKRRRFASTSRQQSVYWRPVASAGTSDAEVGLRKICCASQMEWATALAMALPWWVEADVLGLGCDSFSYQYCSTECSDESVANGKQVNWEIEISWFN